MRFRAVLCLCRTWILAGSVLASASVYAGPQQPNTRDYELAPYPKREASKIDPPGLGRARLESGTSTVQDIASRRERLSPEERRQLRLEVREYGREIYPSR